MSHKKFSALVKEGHPREYETHLFVTKHFGRVWISKWSVPKLFHAYIPHNLKQVHEGSFNGEKNRWIVQTKDALTQEPKEFDWCTTFTREYLPLHLHPEKRAAVQNLIDVFEREAKRMRQILELEK